MSQVNARLVQRVRRRAHGCCEYCQSQERVVGEAFTIDHIIPHAKAGGIPSRTSRCAATYATLSKVPGPKPLTRKPATLSRFFTRADSGGGARDGQTVVGSY
jgi:hypothetical protein